MAYDLPPRMVERLASARKVLEVGAGRDFSTALAVARAAPQALVLVSDLDARVLKAPEPLVPLLLDVHAPESPLVEGVDLVFAVRIPEELQLACLRLARRLDADLALRPLKDEWAHMEDARIEHWGSGWRYRARRLRD